MVNQGERQPRDTDLTDSDICYNKHKMKKKKGKWNNIIQKKYVSQNKIKETRTDKNKSLQSTVLMTNLRQELLNPLKKYILFSLLAPDFKALIILTSVTQ